jgi:GNAT superfamily N-acetyltransferase
LGFGSYVVDAYAQPNKIEDGFECPYQIWLAEVQHLKDLKKLYHESLRYYKAAPLFLKREPDTTEYIKEMIEAFNIYIAWDGNKMIGFVQVSTATKNDPETLVTRKCGLIEGLGIYIKPEYRGKLLGISLLNDAFDYCDENSLDFLHVDFETANPYGNKFWRKHFKPMTMSVRRTVNKDANTER